MDTTELERLREQYAEIVDEMNKDSSRAAHHFGRLEIIAKQLFRLIDRAV
jgi:hypothetical protein